VKKDPNKSLSKARNKNPEDVLQAELFSRLNQWALIPALSEIIHWIHSVPNGGLRDKNTANTLKATGLTSGVSDVTCPFPSIFREECVSYNSFYVELKYGKGKASDAQLRFHKFIESVGGKTLVSNDIAELEFEIMKYVCGCITLKGDEQFQVHKFAGTSVVSRDQFYALGVTDVKELNQLSCNLTPPIYHSVILTKRIN
jgi:hypothetical protein